MKSRYWHAIQGRRRGPAASALAQSVDENLDQTRHACLPAGMVLHGTHAHERTQKVFGTDIGPASSPYVSRRPRHWGEIVELDLL